MKKTLTLLTTLALLFFAVGCEEFGTGDNTNPNDGPTEQPGGETNDDPAEGGSTPESYKIYYTSTDGNIITPKGDFGANVVSNTYEDNGGVLVFDDVVTTIGSQAFEGCETLKSVVVGDVVTTIEDGAFSGCSSLNSVYIGKGVVNMGWCVFQNCVIDEMFINAKFIEADTKHASTVYESCAGSHWYDGATIKKVEIGDNVTRIGANAFSDWFFEYGDTSDWQHLTSVTIPDSVVEIGESAFDGCSGLTSVVIPDSVTSIGNGAFLDCVSLESVVISDNITVIADNVFCNCSSLKTVTIPAGVKSLGDWAFLGCDSLMEIYCKPTTPPALYYMPGDFWSSAMGSLPFNTGMKIFVPRSSYDDYTQYTASYDGQGPTNWFGYSSYIQPYDFD